MKCLKCNRENRDEAKYCRFCGEEIAQSVQNVQNGQSSHGAQAAAQNAQSAQSAPAAPAATNPVDGFIGHEKIRELLNKFIILRRQEKMDEESGGTSDSKNTIFLFSGNPGTGKKTVAEWFANQLKAEKLVAGRIETMDAQQLKKHGKDEYELYDYIAQNNFGVLIIREVHRETEYLNEIINAFYKSKNGCVCICIGLKNKLDDFLKKNPDSKQRIKPVDFDNYTDNTLYEILEYKLKQMGLKHDASVCDILKDFVVEENNKENKEYENGWLIENAVIQKIKEARAERISNGENTSPEIIKDDIPLKNRRRTEEEILTDLDSLIGLTDLKKEIRKLMDTVKAQKKKADTGKLAKLPEIHIQFIGNPGTGKTTVARMLGELFNSIGLLPSSKVVECDRSKLIAPYVGQTAPLVNEYCDKAMGGILFIDEAYSLKQGDGDNFGQEAVDALLKRMEDDRGKFVVIAAGYKDEMRKFLDSNTGFKSRFTHTIELPDYNVDELIQIYKLYAKKQEYILNSEAEKVLEKVIKQMYASRSKNFANAREVRNLFDSTIRKQSMRLMQLPESEQTTENLMEIKAEDIQLEEKENKEQTKEEILKELDSMIGLEGVKKEVHTLLNAIEVENERAEATGDIAKKPVRHIVLTGNPGTGKTTVARILGKLFKSIGLLPNDNFILASRGDLVGQYVGHTAPLVNEVCDRAIGGTLFIDEAYSLVQGDSDQFGHEAVDTLLQRMENDRGKYVVIAAGYEKNMKTFIESNPGLKSRFTTFIPMEDYNTEELYELFILYARKEKFIIEDDAVDILKDCISYIYENKGPDFANGRTIRNFYDKVKDKQSSRIVKLSKEERSKILCLLSAEDVTAAFEEFKEAGI